MVLGAALGVTTAVVALVLHVVLIYGLPAQQVALETAATLVTLLAGILVFGRLRRNSRLNDLALVAALAVITLSNMLFVMLPMLMGSATANPAVWAAIIGRSVGSLLFAVATFVPCVCQLATNIYRENRWKENYELPQHPNGLCFIRGG